VNPDLLWWIESLLLHCSNPIVKPEATLTIVQCLQFRLGSNLPRSENGGQMDIFRGTGAYQLLGVEGCIPGHAILSQGQIKHGSADQIGQPHSYSLPQQDGQPNKISSLPPLLRDLGVVFGASHNTTCQVLGREGQHCCRLGVSPS